jgi:hypothetical protein
MRVVDVEPQGEQPGGRLLSNRRIWKEAIYALAFLTYICSFLFFALAVDDIVHGEDTAKGVFDILVALYFLIQVIFLFILSWFVERRRQQMPIRFPDRRH